MHGRTWVDNELAIAVHLLMDLLDVMLVLFVQWVKCVNNLVIVGYGCV